MKHCQEVMWRITIAPHQKSEIEDLVIADDDYLHGREVNDDIDIDYELSDVL